jgi:dipeptidyl aminopeptidase/acylaminoacyl peptidase
MPRDLTPGAFDSPTWFLGAPDAYAISPDGTEVVFSSNRTGHPAWSTNDDLYIVPAAGGEPRNITADNPGSDAAPQYSPDGRYIAYTSQSRDGYESDLVRLFIYERKTGARQHVNPGYDNWVSSFAWAPDSDTIYFTASERGRHPIFKTSASKPKVEKVFDGYLDDVSVLPGGSGLVFTRTSLTEPVEIFRLTFEPGATPMKLTHGNEVLLAELDLNPVEDVTTKGVRGDETHSLLLKPPAFNANAKYPAVVLIHGGPQSNWVAAWGYRWNAQLFAARGYVVLMPNPPGSTGYGQAYVERISGDYGGDHYQDLMRAVDWLEAQPYVDKNRIGAAGASFGGYMVNWIAGQTARFKALVSHAGLFDLRSKYGATEELWFPEWDNRGAPWENPELYRKFSPSFYADKIQTPMLIVHGEHDYRVPYTQGLQIFTALQRRGVRSKLLFFPDEGHWILKPQNSRLWYETVLGWLDEHLK